MMTAKDAQNHMEDTKDHLKLLLFHEQTLLREIELLRPKVESRIVLARKGIDIRNVKQDDLNIDVVPANLCDMETIQARKAFYYAPIELANVRAEIAVKKLLYESYKLHIQQELSKQAAPCTNEMIFEVFHKAQQIKDFTDQEKASFENISANLMKNLNSGNEKRIEIYETLLNLIKLHS
jgi:hypothetical protein